MMAKIRLKKPILLLLTVYATILFMSPHSYAGMLDDATQSVLESQTGIKNRAPSIVITEVGVKPAIQKTAEWMIEEGNTLYNNPGNFPLVPPMNGMTPPPPPEVGGAFWATGGKVIGGTMVVIKVVDTANSWRTLSDTSKYDVNAQRDYIIADKTLHAGEAIAGTGEVILITVAYIGATGMIAVSAPVMIKAAAVCGTVKFGLKVTRAAAEKGDRWGMPSGFEIPLPPQKLPPDAVWDPMGLLSGGKPGVYVFSFNRPQKYSDAGSMPFGYWIPANRVKGDPEYYNVIDRIPYETGMNGLRQELPNPAVTGVKVYKPNIYLYHPADGKVNVSLLYEDKITASEPLYRTGSGWTADLRDGSINGSGDFLFYEAKVPDALFQKETGWLVRSGHQSEDMQAILNEYGFNDREKNDFLEYWCGMLDNSATYIFYNQDTVVVDGVMPVETDRTFDERHRIWFYIEPLKNQIVSDPEIFDVIRQHDNALIEWGGIMK